MSVTFKMTHTVIIEIYIYKMLEQLSTQKGDFGTIKKC